MLHYADMLADGRRAVRRLAETANIDADDALVDEIAEASSFGTMKANAADFAPAGGTGFFRNDGDFFDSGMSQKWLGQITQEVLDLFQMRLAQLIPDEKARTWLQYGSRC